VSKPQPKRLPSDDCKVIQGGETYYPHEGEWVEVLPGVTVDGVRQLHTLHELAPKLLAAQGEADEQARILALMDGAFSEVARFLAPRLTAWNWTDDLGRPLPLPDGTPGPLGCLRQEELFWLISAAQGETPGKGASASKPSPTTS